MTEMTHEQAFENLKVWAQTFGYPVEEARFQEWPEELTEGARGFFQRDRIDVSGWIWISSGLPPEERTYVLGHDLGHLAIELLNGEPYRPLTHQPTADVLGRCFVAIQWEDFGNPLFKITTISETVIGFLKILKAKIEHTGRNLAMLEAAHLQMDERTRG